MRQAQTLDVSTAENGAVFWSGQGNQALAEQFAAANGKTTLEMTPGGSWMQGQDLFNPATSPPSHSCADSTVHQCSKRFMKQNKYIEFGISAVKSAGDKVIIEGRCHRGPILPGDTFSALSVMTVQVESKTVGPTTLHQLHFVQMKIESILAYGHKIQELSQTMTAALEVSGTGLGYVKPSLVLSNIEQ